MEREEAAQGFYEQQNRGYYDDNLIWERNVLHSTKIIQATPSLLLTFL